MEAWCEGEQCIVTFSINTWYVHILTGTYMYDCLLFLCPLLLGIIISSIQL